MTPSAPLSIGSFAMLTGLSVPALRHYDAVGVLAPASVDPDSGYRYYATDQIAAGRAIRALRALDLPLDEVGEVVNGAGAEHVRGLLLRHRARLKERASALDRQMADLEAYIEKGVPVTTPPGNRIVMINIPVRELDAARRFYEAMLAVEFCEERHGDGPLHLNATFGEWDTPGWFLLSLWPDRQRAGAADIGFLVDDLEPAYERALAAGGAGVHGPRDGDGMPRNAQIADPSGNQIGLYQG